MATEQGPTRVVYARVPEATHRALAKWAKENGLSIADTVNILIRRALKADGVEGLGRVL